jgi:two-component system response regulator VicR
MAEECGPVVLIVEDERPLAAILRENLERAGYGVEVADDGGVAVEAFGALRPALVLLDLMLPKLSGFAVCEAIRAQSSVPILVLTARDAEEDKLRGFEVGADDYLTKPFSLRELLARIRALLRRAAPDDGGFLRCDDIVLDPRARGVQKAGRTLELSVREFDLLAFLMRRPGQLFSREELLSEVWGYDYVGDSARTVDVTVWRLRNKVEDDPREPRYVLSRRGAGYLFRPRG